MKAGLLYPRSKAHPALLPDFVDGLKAALEHLHIGGDIEILSESISYGGIEKEVVEKAEKLLLLDGADVLVAFIDLRILELLTPIFYSSGKLVLVVNPGANYPENWIPQPNILYLTLQHGFLSWLSGTLAAKANHKHAAMATTFYDCGYMHAAAMVKGFEKAGGAISYNYVYNKRYDDSFEINPLTDFLLSDKTTDALLCIFDSLPASLFYSRLNAFSGAGNLHLFVSPMMLQDQALEQVSAGCKFSIQGFLPWHASLELEANREFMNSFLQQKKRVATEFAMLGWETGLVLYQVLQHSQNQYADGAELAQKLVGIKINSPRGELNLDPETNYFIAPFCKYAASPGKLASSVEWIANPEKDWAEFAKMTTEGPSSGWTNTYLCY
jgi:branched-chain amino acid transport system substrate-binding protein